MTALLVSIPVSLGLGLVGLWAFFWALRHNQFDDPEGNAWRVIEADSASQPAGQNRDSVAPDAADRDTAEEP